MKWFLNSREYQRELREKQVERTKAILAGGNHKKTWKNPNDPARFIDKSAVTNDGETVDILYVLDEQKIVEEARYDGFYAICTTLFEDDSGEILKGKSWLP